MSVVLLRVRLPSGEIVEMTRGQLHAFGPYGCQSMAVDLSPDGSGRWARASNMLADPGAVGPGHGHGHGPGLDTDTDT